VSDYPDISVIIPCYNSSETIQRALESVLLQEGVDTEIILIDDGSTDSSVEKAREIAGKQLQILKIAGPGGTARARNAGLKIAKGNWIQFLDSDDSLEPEKFRRQLENSDRVDIVLSDWKIFRAGKAVSKQSSLGFINATDKIETLIRGNELISCAPLLRREFIEQTGYFTETLYHEDWEFWLRIFLQNPRVSHCSGYLSNYHKNPGGKTWNNTEKIVADIQLLEYLLAQPEYSSYAKFTRKVLRSKRLDAFTAYWINGRRDDALDELRQLNNPDVVEILIIRLVKTGIVSRLLLSGYGPKILKRKIFSFFSAKAD